MGKNEEVILNVEDGAIGSEIECYARIENLRYPKKSFDQMEYGEWGIIALYTEDVLKGKLPDEFNRKSFFVSTKKEVDGHFIATGKLPKLDFSKLYYFKGILVENPKYGLQYNIEEFHQVYKLKEEETEIFLHAIFSDYRANKLIDNFKDPLLPLKEKDISALCALPGIGYATAQEMIRIYEENFEQGTAYVQLAEYGLTPRMIQRLQDTLKSVDSILYILQTDPYSLIDLVDGVGWKTADQIAANSGNFGPCDEKRVRAYIKFFLRECVNDYGHSWVDLDYLVTAIKTEIPNLQDEDLAIMLRRWIQSENGRKPWLYYEEESRRIGLNYYREVEKRIAQQLIRIEHENAKVYSNEEINDGIAEAEAQLGFQYTEEQKQAIHLCLTNGVTIISGSAGVGKTTIMKAVTTVLMKANQEFAQCSLSGKASSNLTEVTGVEGRTIHRLLGYNPETGQFGFNRKLPLSKNLIIVDELSLIGGELFLQLLEAIPNGCKLICLGDEKQLESIGMANLLKDCINCHVLPAQRLIKIHRQAAKSGIITESLRASAGEQIVSHNPGIEYRGELQDFKIVSCTESSPVADNFIEEYKNLFFNKHIPVKDIMGVVPMRNKGGVDCLSLNRKIQAIVNPIPRIDDVIVTRDKEDYTLRVGDKILVVKNNYETTDATAVDKEGKEVPKIPIFNGNTGFVEEINKQKGYIVLDLWQGKVKVPFRELSDIELGYVLTAHKAQGSGVPYVIIGLSMSAYALLSKEWIYTAMTRAKKFCILCTQINAARQAVTISRVQIKHTWLQELLINGEKEYQATKTYSLYEVTDKLKDYIGQSEELRKAYVRAEKLRTKGDNSNE